MRNAQIRRFTDYTNTLYADVSGTLCYVIDRTLLWNAVGTYYVFTLRVSVYYRVSLRVICLNKLVFSHTYGSIIV